MKENNEAHPIIKEVLNLARVGKEPIELDEDAIDQIQDSLENLFESQELFKAVVDLINLAHLFEKEGAPTASLSLITIIASAAEPLKKLDEKRQEKG